MTCYIYMLYNIIMSYITYLVTWYTLCYIPCVSCYMKAVYNIMDVT